MAHRVLLVDDSVDILEMLTSIICMETDYEVRQATSAKAALSLVEEWGPDVMLIDLMMPDMTGLDLIDRVRERSPSRPRIVAVSGFSELEAEAMARGASEFRLKPVDSVELMATIDSLVDDQPRAENPRLAALARRRAASERARRALSAARLQRPHFQSALNRSCRVLGRYFDVTAAIILLEDGEPKVLASSSASMSRAISYVNEVIESGSALVVPDLRDHPWLFKQSSGSKIRFLVASPIRLPEGSVVGCVVLMNPEPRPFDATDLAILQDAARCGTEVLRGLPPPVFLWDSGFLELRVWSRWLGEELAHAADGRLLRIATVETARHEWPPGGAEELLESLRPRSAVAFSEPRSLYFYEIAEKGAPSGVDAFVSGVEEATPVLNAAVVTVADLLLAQKVEAVLAVADAVLAAARRRGAGVELAVELVPHRRR